MLLSDDDTVLWLRDRSELQMNPVPTHAILWPAIEYTALVSAEPVDFADRGLDPFERAVIGLARNGVIEVMPQAVLLDLHPAFVAHIQDRLRVRELVDQAGRPRGAASQSTTTSVAAVRLYQDPFSGAIWKRYVTESRRRSLPIGESDRGTTLDAGTTGEPVPIRVFVMRPKDELPAAPTSDDAREAVREWSRTLRQQRVERKHIVDNGSVQIIPESQQHVYLCCPNGRSNPGDPDVLDPFGGHSDRQFRRAIADQAETFEALGRWIYGDAGVGAPQAWHGDDDTSLSGQLGVITTRLASELGRLAARPQQKQDIDAIGHAAIDQLWAVGTERIEDLATNLTSDRNLLDAFAIKFGFLRGTVPAAVDLRSICSGGSAPLVERVAATLMRFRPDVGGPLHRVATRSPDLFQLLRESDAGGATSGLEQRATAVFALAEEADRLRPAPTIISTGATTDE